ncbi:MAG TPA: NPCBM/NEW2 domain-containing protein [Gemmataceae bacterium]|nr:NPCBM/NEW2 domain-containing protein [Gemmataceae bacterium]
MLSPVFAFLIVTGGTDTADFEVRGVGGIRETADLQSVAADGTITLAGGKSVPGGDWYSARRAGIARPPWPREPHAELGNADQIVGTVASADGDAVRLRVLFPDSPAQVLRIPLSALKAVWFTYRRDAHDPEWLTAERKRDVIQSRNGDLALGALVGMDGAAKILRYQADGKDLQLDLSKVAAIGFNTDLARVRRPKGPYYRLTLANGTRLSATGVAFDGASWSAQSLFKEVIKIPADQVVAVDVEQGKAVWLSELKPSKYQYHPFDAEDHSWAADRCVSGQAMRLKTVAGESTFDRGVGLHAGSTLTYALGGKFRRWEALAGLDARSGVRGDAILVVRTDGKERELPAAGRLTAAGGALAIELDVTGVKELTIDVRRGNGGGVQDHVNLAEARLVP